MKIILALLVLNFIIFIHELGHFLTAKLFKMPVSEFAIGMGPKVISYDTMKTSYAIRSIPVGGFVTIEGMDYENYVEDGFNSKPAYAKIIVLSAGVIMNFILAFVVLFYLSKDVQITKYAPGTQIETISKDSKAYNLLMPNDTVLEIEGKKVANWDEVSKVINAGHSKEENPDNRNVEVKIKRDDKVEMIKIPLTYDSDTYYLGVVPKLETFKPTLKQRIEYSLNSGVGMFKATFDGLKLLVTGKVKAKELAGPVGIIQVVGSATENGFVAVMYLMAFLSINIGILNLLPFPALDGGRIIFVLLELIGIRVSKKIEERIHLVGMIILFSFIIYATTNDISRLVG